jgi:hypothetical protein
VASCNLLMARYECCILYWGVLACMCVWVHVTSHSVMCMRSRIVSYCLVLLTRVQPLQGFRSRGGSTAYCLASCKHYRCLQAKYAAYVHENITAMRLRNTRHRAGVHFTRSMNNKPIDLELRFRGCDICRLSTLLSSSAKSDYTTQARISYTHSCIICTFTGLLSTFDSVQALRRTAD